MSKFNNKFFSNIWVSAYELYGFYTRITNKYTPYMNLGFQVEQDVEIEDEDKWFQPNINLYYKILQDNKVKNTSVLEVGCGRGGGCYFFVKYGKATSVYGLDKSNQNIKLCQKYFNSKEYKFSIGDATDFKLNQNFDYVINLESSHSYPNLLNFYECVKNVLKNEGLFFYADIFVSSELKEIESKMEIAGLTIVGKENITDGVVKSIEKNSIRWFPFSTKYPKLTPSFVKVFNASLHSDIFKKLKNGELQYYCYVVKK